MFNIDHNNSHHAEMAIFNDISHVPHMLHMYCTKTHDVHIPIHETPQAGLLCGNGVNLMWKSCGNL